MTPVVNGLKAEFNELVEFHSLDAGTGTGERVFNSYELPGHPSYIILDPSGEVLWKSFGPQSKVMLASAIEDAIAVIESA
ncbi:MAG: TlpA family protein disulfide reductase [Candidatus Hermodarchaeia archaeon]|jgi:hypothetical protein